MAIKITPGCGINSASENGLCLQAVQFLKFVESFYCMQTNVFYDVF